MSRLDSDIQGFVGQRYGDEVLIRLTSCIDLMLMHLSIRVLSNSTTGVDWYPA